MGVLAIKHQGIAVKTQDFRLTIVKAATRQKMSIHAVGILAGCNPQTLYNYLAGRSEIKADLLSKVLAVLKLKIIDSGQ